MSPLSCLVFERRAFIELASQRVRSVNNNQEKKESMNNFEFSEKMKTRTKVFAVQIVKFYKALPKTDEARILGKQVLRSGTSVAANYRAACRSKSRADFISKLGTTVEEADETLLWIELLEESGIAP